MLEKTHFSLPKVDYLKINPILGSREIQLKKIGYNPILDATKNKISEIPQLKWSRLRKALNNLEFPFDSSKIQKPVSRAFFKLLEIVVDLNIDCTGNTLHLAEAPGGFIEATKYIKTKRKLGTTDLYYTFSMVGNSDVPTYNRSLSKDKRVIILSNKENGGNLYILENIKFLIKTLESKSINFITCDGGFTENNDFSSKEQLHHHLIFKEIIVSIFILSNGGTLVCKIFDIFTELTFDYIYLLSFLFEDVCICKPNTSRPTNSEKYLVCKGFIKSKFDSRLQKIIRTLCVSGIENYKSFICKSLVSKEYIKSIYDINTYLLGYQITNINNTIEIGNFFPNSKKITDDWINKYY